MRIIYEDLIKLAKNGEFNVITHSCNCFCRMKRGIAPVLAHEFGCDKFPLEQVNCGDINKLGTIDHQFRGLHVVNSYMQYHWKEHGKWGFPFDYDACKLCLRKINHEFKGQSIGLPMVGCGLAGANATVVLSIIEKELMDMEVTVVILPSDQEKFRVHTDNFIKGYQK